MKEGIVSKRRNLIESNKSNYVNNIQPLKSLANTVERLWNLSGVFSAEKYLINNSLVKFKSDFNNYEFAAVEFSSPQSVPVNLKP